jgi:DNA-binding MarR family transcriptional regulator
MSAVTSIMRAQQIVLGRLNAELEPLGLTFPRYEALMLLTYTRRGELPLGKISDRLQVSRASVTNVVDKLCDSGFVERVAHEEDRRAILASVTAEGRRVARRATGRLHAIGFGMAPMDDAACDEVSAHLRALRLDAGDFADS